MKLSKLFGFAKKGARAAAKKQGDGKSGGGIEWPDGIRIGVFGQANSGKSVYFTVLNEESKISKDLQLSVTDTATAGQLLSHYRNIWGIGSTNQTGTVVDLHEEKKFPSPTSGRQIFLFNAILNRTRKLPVVTLDYDGNAVAIAEPHAMTDEVMDFMSGCDGLLFFFDPKVLGAELQTQAYVAAFASMIERLAPISKRLPIPCALVVTKADILPGFTAEDQVSLIPDNAEHLLAEDFELFLENILSSSKIKGNPTWASTVRNILVKMKEFLKIVVGRTLDFQVFFTSCTGSEPEKIGTDVGRSLYAPPAQMRPIGVREPFHWVLQSITRNRKLSSLRKVTKWVAALALIWIVALSIPHLYHYTFLLNRATGIEQDVLTSYGGVVANTNQNDRSRIKSAYENYERSWLVRNFYTRFQVPARKLHRFYYGFNVEEAIASLDSSIYQMANVVNSQSLWPTVHPAKDSLELNAEHQMMEADVAAFHQGQDETSELYTRSGRTLVLWELFKELVKNPSDTATMNKVAEQVAHDRQMYGSAQSRAEQALGNALAKAATAKKETKVKKERERKAVETLSSLMALIESKGPEYKLTTAVTKLRELRARLEGNSERKDDVKKIDKYLKQARHFDKERDYKIKVTHCPDGYHMHMRVVGKGNDEGWKAGKMLLKGRDHKFEWKAGDDIYISLHENHRNPDDESWGERYESQLVFKDKYCLFKLDRPLEFPNGAKVAFTFDDDPREELPEFDD